jgi:hypothetical protein
MAIKDDISKEDEWFAGEQKDLVFTIFQTDDTTPQDISGWGLSWMLKRNPRDADAAAVLHKTTALGGVTLTTPATGICTVTVEDQETDGLGGTYYHELKRVDPGAEAVLSYGRAVLQDGLHDS